MNDTAFARHKEMPHTIDWQRLTTLKLISCRVGKYVLISEGGLSCRQWELVDSKVSYIQMAIYPCTL